MCRFEFGEGSFPFWHGLRLILSIWCCSISWNTEVSSFYVSLPLISPGCHSSSFPVAVLKDCSFVTILCRFEFGDDQLFVIWHNIGLKLYSILFLQYLQFLIWCGMQSFITGHKSFYIVQLHVFILALYFWGFVHELQISIEDDLKWDNC